LIFQTGTPSSTFNFPDDVAAFALELNSDDIARYGFKGDGHRTRHVHRDVVPIDTIARSRMSDSAKSQCQAGDASGSAFADTDSLWSET